MTVIHLVQVDVSVDQLVNSVHVNLVIQVLSVISVTRDIMDSLTAEVSYYPYQTKHYFKHIFDIFLKLF